MTAIQVLWVFLGLRLAQHLVERWLSWLNRRHFEDPERQGEAARVLGIAREDLEKTLGYSRDRHRFGAMSAWTGVAATLLFIGLGGLGLLEQWAQALASALGGGPIVTGLLFFGLLGALTSLFGLPFDYYDTFVLEQRHGFNRQTRRGFVIDRIKGTILAVILGGAILAVLLWIMEIAGDLWWLWAWAAVSAFSLLTAWLYPTVLAPLFNKFEPVADERLREGIMDLARRVDFKAEGVSVMDASRRSTHGNAYFTGVFGKKKIVLFDNLVKSMSHAEIIAVLAHELGHFKLHHVRWGLIRSFALTFVIFFLIGQLLPFEVFYRAFALDGVSHYGALLVFSLWFGPVSFLLQPLGNHLSRRNEFAADRFALAQTGGSRDLGSALLKLRETSHVMPISHPWYSTVYHSHPPLLERLAAMGYI